MAPAKIRVRWGSFELEFELPIAFIVLLIQMFWQ